MRGQPTATAGMRGPGGMVPRSQPGLLQTAALLPTTPPPPAGLVADMIAMMSSPLCKWNNNIRPGCKVGRDQHCPNLTRSHSESIL